MKIAVLILVIFVSAISMADDASFSAEELKGTWVLEIKNLTQEAVTTIHFRFTEKKADSCLEGRWRQLDVLSYTTKDDSFFPVKQPLSYELRENRIVIGRNLKCDAYLQLAGELQNAKSSGEYTSFGWGSKKLGYFTLTKAAHENPYF